MARRIKTSPFEAQKKALIETAGDFLYHGNVVDLDESCFFVPEDKMDGPNLPRRGYLQVSPRTTQEPYKTWYTWYINELLLAVKLKMPRMRSKRLVVV